MKNKKTIYNSDEFRKTVQCLTEKIREADELESVDVDKSFQDVMKRVGREKKVPHRRHIYRWSLSIAAAIALALVMNWWSTNVDEGTELDIALLNDTTSICGDEVILDRVHVGDSLKVICDRYPDTELSGTVVSIAGMGVQKQNASYYNVKLSLSTSLELLPGMNATVYLP